MKKILMLICSLLIVFGCSSPNSENLNKAQEQLSVAADLVFAISDMYLAQPGSWGSNGSVYCDASNRCISDRYDLTDASTGILVFSMPQCNSLSNATLNFSTTEWNSIVPKAEIRRILPQITLPTCPYGGVASNSTIGWRYSSSNAAWNVLGAHGVGTDVSLENVSISVGSGGNVTHSVDITTIVNSCLGNTTCNLAIFSVPDAGQTLPSHHFWLITGTPALILTCDNSGTSTNTTTTTSSTTSTSTATCQ